MALIPMAIVLAAATAGRVETSLVTTVSCGPSHRRRQLAQEMSTLLAPLAAF